MSAGAIAANL